MARLEARAEQPSKFRLEVRSEQDLQVEDIADLRNFANSEAQNVRGMPPTEDGWDERWSAAIVHLMAHSELTRAVSRNSPVDVVLLRDMHNELIGYALAILDPKAEDELKRVQGTFIGVREDQRRRGLGTSVLEVQIKNLRARGITTHIVEATKNTVGLYKKLGISFTSHTKPSNPKAQTLVVDLGV